MIFFFKSLEIFPALDFYTSFNIVKQIFVCLWCCCCVFHPRLVDFHTCWWWSNLLLFLSQIHKHFALFSSLPQIACLAFLSFQYPLLLFKGFKGSEGNHGSEVRLASSPADLWSYFLWDIEDDFKHVFWSVLGLLCELCVCVLEWERESEREIEEGGRRLTEVLIVLVQSGLRGETWSPALCAACLINLSGFDVIGLCYVQDQIMKRAPCIYFFFFLHQWGTKLCLFDHNLSTGVTKPRVFVRVRAWWWKKRSSTSYQPFNN